MRELTTVKHTLSTIFDAKIKIPEYQRDYQWGTSKATDLIEDIFTMADESDLEREYDDFLRTIDNMQDFFYLGQIVKQEDDIVDGQQRLTTILIIFKALSDYSSEEFNGHILHGGGFMDSFDEYKMQSSIRDTEYSRIIQSSSTIKEYIKLKGVDEVRKEEIIKFKKSKFFKNYNAIYRWIKAIVTNKTRKKLTKDGLKSLFMFIRKKVHFIVVSLTNTEDAINFFEIMNSKTLPLTPADLIRNHMIKIMSKDDIKSAAKKWDEITSELGDNISDLSKYIRYIYIARIGTVSQSKLFEKIKGLDGNKTNILDLISNYMESFKLLTNRADTGDISSDSLLRGIRSLATESLNPVLLEILRNKTGKERNELLKELLSFSFKFFYIAGFKSNSYANSIHDICTGIREGSKNPLSLLWLTYEENIKYS
ncbi:MAG: DUF262 domain-containing protein, partial [Mycoplasmataceae bacterium]|nr:DUF262 domain-containing protein [Mycoplasmataceae bacterium]